MDKKECGFSIDDFLYAVEGGNTISKWWPHRLNLKILQQNNPDF